MANNIPRGGLKTMGGSGRVVWLEDGKVVDHEWCLELTNWDDLDNFDKIKHRTIEAFP